MLHNREEAKMKKYRKYAIVALIILLPIISLQVMGANEPQKQTLYQSLRHFNDILRIIDNRYAQDVDPVELVNKAIRGMLSSLDPYSVYMDERIHKEFMIRTTGAYGGLGFEVGMVDGWVTVISPFEGTPAWSAGLKPGDKVINIEGVSTKGISLDEAVSKMRGDPGTKVTITIAREGVEEPIDLTIERAKIKVESIPHFGLIDKDIGYIRISSFSPGVGKSLTEVLKELDEMGAKKLILDLRGNPGGYLNEAVNVADNFIDKGHLIVSELGQTSSANRKFYARRAMTVGEFPLIVLVNRGSASASEIVAGAVQDWDRGLVVGDTTFGKGLVQTLIPLDEGSALKLTIARYYTPSGRCIDKTDTLRFMLKNPTLTQEYQTSGKFKRPIRSAGAIVPDIVLEYQKTPQLLREIARKGLFMQYASKYVSEHKDIREDFKIEELDLKEFRAFIEDKGIEIEEEELNEAKSMLTEVLELSIAENVWGIKGRYKILLDYDPWVKEAKNILETASSVDQLFVTLSGNEKEMK